MKKFTALSQPLPDGDEDICPVKEDLQPDRAKPETACKNDNASESAPQDDKASESDSSENFSEIMQLVAAARAEKVDSGSDVDVEAAEKPTKRCLDFEEAKETALQVPPPSSQQTYSPQVGQPTLPCAGCAVPVFRRRASSPGDQHRATSCLGGCRPAATYTTTAAGNVEARS